MKKTSLGQASGAIGLLFCVLGCHFTPYSYDCRGTLKCADGSALSHVDISITAAYSSGRGKDLDQTSQVPSASSTSTDSYGHFYGHFESDVTLGHYYLDGFPAGPAPEVPAVVIWLFHRPNWVPLALRKVEHSQQPRGQCGRRDINLGEIVTTAISAKQ